MAFTWRMLAVADAWAPAQKFGLGLISCSQGGDPLREEAEEEAAVPWEWSGKLSSVSLSRAALLSPEQRGTRPRPTCTPHH